MYTLQKPATRQKRKIVLEDSDEEGENIDALAYKKGLSAYQPSPEPVKKSSGTCHSQSHLVRRDMWLRLL